MSIVPISRSQSTSACSRFQRRVARLLQMREIFRATVATTIDALARQFGVSRRTIFRDINTLIACDVEIEYSTDLGGHVASNPDSRHPTPSVDQLIGLLLAAASAPKQAFPNYASAAKSLLAAIVERSRPRCLPQAQAMIEALNIVIGEDQKIAPQGNGQSLIFEQVIRAIANRCSLRAHFRSPLIGRYSSTLLSAPYRLRHDDVWRLTARSSLHRARMSFRVDDMCKVECVEPDTISINLRSRIRPTV